jgi:hypothetical protein
MNNSFRGFHRKSFVNNSNKGYEMLRKPSLIAASVAAGMIISATVSADIVIKSGTGLTQTLIESSIHYDDFGNRRYRLAGDIIPSRGRYPARADHHHVQSKTAGGMLRAGQGL